MNIAAKPLTHCAASPHPHSQRQPWAAAWLAAGLIVAHQIALEAGGLREYILTAPRVEGFTFSANKEVHTALLPTHVCRSMSLHPHTCPFDLRLQGLSSVPGYLAVSLLGQAAGHWLLSSVPVLSSKPAGGRAPGCGGATGGRVDSPLVSAVRLPDGCSTAEVRPFFATVDQWGGDAVGQPTCKLRAVCSFRRGGHHVMVSDHMWLDGDDAGRIIAMQPTNDRPIVTEQFGRGTRPKRGMKFFMTAMVVAYAPGKAKLHRLERVEPLEFTEPRKQRVYWAEGMPRDTESALWHGGGGGRPAATIRPRSPSPAATQPGAGAEQVLSGWWRRARQLVAAAAVLWLVLCLGPGYGLWPTPLPGPVPAAGDPPVGPAAYVSRRLLNLPCVLSLKPPCRDGFICVTSPSLFATHAAAQTSLPWCRYVLWLLAQNLLLLATFLLVELAAPPVRRASGHSRTPAACARGTMPDCSAVQRRSLRGSERLYN